MNTCSYIHMSVSTHRPPATTTSPADHDARCAEPHGADPAALESISHRLLGAGLVTSVADVFKLLGDPTRVRILDALTHGERCVCDLATLVGLSESAVSHQLRLLRGARLVRVRRSGRLAFY